MSNFFCPLPWIHQFVQPTGVKYCCSSTELQPVTPLEFQNSEYLKQVKETIRAGNVPAGCRSCVAKEAKGYDNTRQIALRDWHYDIDTVPDRIEYLDLRYDNQCNFKCRSCEPAFSSQIEREVNANPQLVKYFVPASPRIHELVDITPVLDNVKRINFTGGEPLIIKENLEILEHLIDTNQTHVAIQITTNASTLNNKIIKLINGFNNLHFTVSIDSVAETAEYIRDGTVWARVSSNIAEILDMNVSTTINCTVSAYSVLTLARLTRYFAQLKEIYPTNSLELMFSVVQTPAQLVPVCLPAHLRKIAIDNVTESINILKQISSNPLEHLGTLIQLKKNLENVKIHASTNRFIQFTNTLDQIRGQDFSTTFGEQLNDI